jgi:hypothetical protein
MEFLYMAQMLRRTIPRLLARWFAELFFDPEDGGDTFLRNVGYNSTDYTASYPRR